MYNELPLIEAAFKVLQDEKKPVDLYELFDKVSAGRKFSKDQKVEELSSFYNDLTISAKFVYTGTNTWNLKANEKIELWEKDGSFYKEYTVVTIPDEYKDKPRVINPKIEAAPLAKPVKTEEKVEAVVKPKKAAAKPKKVAKAVKVEEVVEEVVEVVEVIEVVEEAVIAEPAVEVPVAASGDDTDEVFEEEVFEEYEDFDEDKYNEYMDTYEDKYDK